MSSQHRAEWLMSVVCIGDRWVLDRVGEKHDFETSLTRAGFRHEEFVLHVKPLGSAPAPSVSGYEVKVTHASTQTVKAYSGGPSKDWVARFAEDLSGGLFGQPVVPVGKPVALGLTASPRRPKNLPSQ